MERIACLLLVAVGLAAAPAAAAPVMPGVPSYAWLFDDGTGSTLTALRGGPAADGALLGGAGPSWSSDTPFGGAGDTSLHFDGADDVVDVAGLNAALEGWSAFSLSVWVRSDSLDQDRAFFSGQAPAAVGQDLFGFRYDDSGWLSGGSTQNLLKIGLQIDGAGYQYESAEFVQTTSWQHLVLVWNGTGAGAGLQVYVDGVLDVPTANQFTGVTGALSDQPRFLIGDGPKAHWDGRIDELALWDQALGSDEVAWLGANSLASMPLPVPEPSTLPLLMAGLLGLTVAGRPRSGRLSRSRAGRSRARRPRRSRT